MSKVTRFRAYQLGEKGSSFSYSVDNYFILIEARYNGFNSQNIENEMKQVGANNISCLHITSWDTDHCSDIELKVILDKLKPGYIRYPGYEPDTDCGKNSLKLIKDYCKQNYQTGIETTPKYVNSLEPGESCRFNDIIYNPIKEEYTHNDNSIAELFRRGRFTVLSLGDCESEEIAKRIEQSSIATNETDVLILAHHGADNGFTTDEFIKAIKPKVAICSSNYDNQYEHPRDSVRNILYGNDVRLFTTKTGDVTIECGEDNKVHVSNYTSGNTVMNSTYTFNPRCFVRNE